MRQSAIDKLVAAQVDSLNQVFDSAPEEVTQLLTLDSAVSVIDLLNAAIKTISPSSHVALIHGDAGIEGFTIGRSKKPSAVQAVINGVS